MITTTDPILFDKVKNEIEKNIDFYTADKLAALATLLFDEKYTYIGEMGKDEIDTFEITQK